ncbi:hypothetical protein [Bacillus thuringiensis]|uniref:hypothetical protein n=1 Tax=Bacillus thuringiensis TaxID=1428 RepID=UPI000BF2E9AF|nr:hypothetical protein [Bacillus thuringiensis]PEQ27988.1 hypothetical protein CN471_28915 [Bacillus thuringiensis]
MSWMLDSLNWVVSNAVGAIAGAGIAGHFLKKKIDHKFNKELAKYNSDLNKELSKELARYNIELSGKLENIKSELQIKNSKEQIEYNELHKDRYQVIKEMNAKIIKLDSCIQKLLLGEEFDESLSKQEAMNRFVELREVMNDIHQYEKEVQILFSKETVYMIVDLQITAQFILHDMYFYYQHDEKQYKDDLEKNIKQKFKDDKNQVESELRRLLGVTVES